MDNNARIARQLAMETLLAEVESYRRTLWCLASDLVAALGRFDLGCVPHDVTLQQQLAVGITYADLYRDVLELNRQVDALQGHLRDVDSRWTDQEAWQQQRDQAAARANWEPEHLA